MQTLDAATVETLFAASMVSEQEISAMKASLDGLLVNKNEHQNLIL